MAKWHGALNPMPIGVGINDAESKICSMARIACGQQGQCLIIEDDGASGH